MTPFSFTHAIVRTPGQSVVHGLRDDPSRTPNYAKVLEEHAAYVAALRAAGVAVDRLDPLEEFPDSIFVEDPALVFANGAILLRPGAPSREGEREPMRAALARHFSTILELKPHEYADGGDVLTTPDMVLIGLSKRTTAAGAEALAAHIAALGRRALLAETPRGVLHFKTAVSLLDEATLLATPAMAASGALPKLGIVVTPAGEEAAANALRVNDRVLVGAHFPRTIDLLTARGYRVVPLPTAEIAKLDAGLSCMSLRWHA